MAKTPERTVHGYDENGAEIVRYERAGKWYLEPTDGGRRRAVTLTEAARLAIAGRVLPNRAGGLAFNAKVRKLGG